MSLKNKIFSGVLVGMVLIDIGILMRAALIYGDWAKATFFLVFAAIHAAALTLYLK